MYHSHAPTGYQQHPVDTNIHLAQSHYLSQGAPAASSHPQSAERSQASHSLRPQRQTTHRSAHNTSEDEEDEEDMEDAAEEEEDDDDDDDDDGPRSAPRAAPKSVRSAKSDSNKKSRITQACDSCRRRKRKCDGTQPVCSSCTKLNLQCSYQTTVKKRGPQAGVVKRLRQEVRQLEGELHREKKNAKLAKFTGIDKVPEAQNQKKKSMSSAAAALVDGLLQDNEGDLTIMSLNAAANSRVRNDTYLTTYFTLLNNTMFPLLEEASFYAEMKRYEEDTTLEVPMSWNLRYAAALSVGSMIYGDVEYAQSAARVARHAASQLFDQPDPQVLRGMLVLAFMCLSTNQQSRAACYLAVATRMCCLVEISPEIPPLATFLEDMMCSVNWWYTGFDLLPAGGYKAQQERLYPEDKIEYENFMHTQRTRIAEVEAHELGNLGAPNQPMRPPPNHSAASAADDDRGSNAGTQQHTPESSSPRRAAGDMSPVLSTSSSPPEDEASLRWELLKVMCFTSGTRGEMNKPPSFSLYRSLYILTKCLISPLTVGAIRTLILYFRVVVLELLGAEKSEILHAATLATEAAQTHDTSHCPFWSLCFHIIAQTHMAYPSPGGPAESEDLLVKDLEVVEKVSHKWEFGLPMLNNLHARILQKYAHMKPSHPVLRTLVESQRAHAQQAQTQNNDAVDDGLMANMSDADRERASTIFTNAIAAAGMDKPKPSIIDTMNSLNDKFSTTMQMNEAELISMTNLRKGLTTGTHAPGIDSIHDSLSPDGVFPNIGIPALAPIAPLISAMRMQSGASPHGAGQAPFEKSYTPPVTQFQRPGLDELMQFEIGDDGPLPNELLQPQPMHSPSLLSPGPGYDASQGMYPPTKDASLGSLGLGGSLFQQGGYRGPSPGAAYGHTIVSPRELQQKEQELRQQLNALIAQQQQQNHQQMYQPPRNDYISSPPAYHPAQAQAHYPQQQQQPGLSPQQILALNSLLSSPTGEGIQQSRYQPSVTPSQYGTQYYSPQVPQVPAQYAGGYDNSYDRIDPAALHGVPAVKPLPSGPYTAYSHLQRTQQ